jgi:hypothetical protein
VAGASVTTVRPLDISGLAGARCVSMIEYEYQTLTFGRDDTRADVRRALAEQAEYGNWELHRVRLYWGGVRKAWLRRKIIRVRRTA